MVIGYWNLFVSCFLVIGYFVKAGNIQFMPYLLNSEEGQKEMLAAIGVSSIEELYAQLPEKIRLKQPLDIPSGLSELEVLRKVFSLSQKNTSVEKMNSFLGCGCYDHYLPAALSYILSSPQFVTAYTPYQAECSQGALQAIYEYQSYLCILTGMDVSNASLFDGASSLAEAALMALRLTKRKKVLVSQGIHPQYLKTLETYLSGFTFTLQEIKLDKEGTLDIPSLKKALDNDTACLCLQSPNFFGLVEDIKNLSVYVKEKQVLTVLVTNPLSLAIFKEPSSLGVDIVCGDGQPLGGNLNFGGPSFGFLAAKSEYLRQMPGRIVGKTLDQDKKPAYCLTLQAREQHIRREKATSNICSNQSLNAIAAALYLALMGKEGLGKAALYSFSLTQYLYQRLKKVRGVKIPYPPRIFNEFLWEVEDAPLVHSRLYKKGIIAGLLTRGQFPEYANGIISCCTEKKTKEEIDSFIFSLADNLRG